ncbi:MAG TPA: GlsB/YeaQ/YmgE family stress response membrane protein [Terracidiphilus sp.]|jgi:uncharacterized membrane protein YeaQ/YmgE (transglycosylase-associated protein family)
MGIVGRSETSSASDQRIEAISDGHHRTHQERRYMFIVWWIILGPVAGYITGKPMKGSGFGAVMDITVGVVGAVACGFFMRRTGFAGQRGLLYTIFVAVIGAIFLTLLPGHLHFVSVLL